MKRWEEPLQFFETSAKLRPLAELIVRLKIKSSKYLVIFLRVNFSPSAILVLQRSLFTFFFILLGLALLAVPAQVECGEKTLRLTVIHVNDTHSNIESASVALLFNKEKTYVKMGGFPRLASKVKSVRLAVKNCLLLHAGDAFQGTPYFIKYKGKADVDLMNMMRFDAMTVGNHEFDRGPEALSLFINQANFPLIAANIDSSNNVHLKDLIAPLVIKKFEGKKVGIIGLDTPVTPMISDPGDDVFFHDPETTAMAAVKVLETMGVNIIIALSHLGYARDIELARAVKGIDLIVGGHSHTLLGDFSAFGLTSKGDYPTRVINQAGEIVYVVQAWARTRAVGVLKVEFNSQGVSTKCHGNTVLLVGTTFKQKNKRGKFSVVNKKKRTEILKIIETSSVIEAVEEEPGLVKKLTPYQLGIDQFRHKKIAKVKKDLWHVRVPDTRHEISNRLMKKGSYLAPIVAKSLLWKIKSAGFKAAMSIQNAGGIRGGIRQGDLTALRVYEILPFENTLYLLELTGKEIKTVLEAAVTRGGAAFPYVAGARYQVDMRRPRGNRVSAVEIKNEKGDWESLNEISVYLVVVNSYLAKGGDGYKALRKSRRYRHDTGFSDTDAFMEYASWLGKLHPPEDTGVVYIR
ncbi:MAG: 5'-nucleotidase C-terminal domain-containing protein [Deltaproteobacteria bacterium]|nr:5'-nucleotidase C-terminal domain-containing protein [Deltaproteobacteria bacterium]